MSSHLNGSIHHLSVSSNNGSSSSSNSSFLFPPMTGRKSASPTIHHFSGGVDSSTTTRFHHGLRSNVDDVHIRTNGDRNHGAANHSLERALLQSSLRNDYDNTSLKLPVTPTRSKSLSPSPRFVDTANNNAFQHPRLRHKNHFKNSQNGSGSSVNESEQSTETVFEPIEKIKELGNEISNKSIDNHTGRGVSQGSSSGKNQLPKPIPKLVYQKDHIDLTFESNNESHNGASIKSDHNDNKHFKQESSNLTGSKFKLPLSLRNVTLNNFPSYQPQNAKRNQSIVMTKLKSANNTDESLRILKNNITSIMSDRIREALDTCKNEFLYPALHNMNKNKNSLSSSDVSFFMASLVDDIKHDLVQEMSPDSQEFKLNMDEVFTTKRKNTDDVAADSVAKRKREQNHNEEKSKMDMITRSSSALRFDSTTKFVLGKSVNELFLKQQQANTNETQEDEQLQGKTSVYAKYPHLLKYDPDHDDRAWLSEKNIIRRKNLKCYLLMWSQVKEMLLNDSEMFKNAGGGGGSNYEFTDDDSLAKVLKPFHLPEFIVYKINKQYFLERKKC